MLKVPNIAIWTTFVLIISHIYTAGWDNRRQRAVVLYSSGPREASEKLKLCKLLAKKVERLGLKRKKGDRGANRYGSAPIMGGFSGR